MATNDLWIDLSDIDLEDIEVLDQEGARGIPEFAASTCTVCTCGTCSTAMEEPADAAA